MEPVRVQPSYDIKQITKQIQFGFSLFCYASDLEYFIFLLGNILFCMSNKKNSNCLI
jgi:hypothetical protein